MRSRGVVYPSETPAMLPVAIASPEITGSRAEGNR